MQAHERGRPHVRRRRRAALWRPLGSAPRRRRRLEREDAPAPHKAAQELGANFVGFVLEEKSKRFINLEKLESLSMIIRKPLKSVALLVDPSNDFLERLLMSSKVDYIQLHGEESPERVEEIAKITSVPLIKAIGVEEETDLLNIRSYESSVDYILLDSKEEENGHLKGGRGVRFNWNIIRGIKRRLYSNS